MLMVIFMGFEYVFQTQRRQALWWYQPIITFLSRPTIPSIFLRDGMFSKIPKTMSHIASPSQAAKIDVFKGGE